MSDWYTQSQAVLPSSCDFQGKLGVDHAFRIFMDIASRHAEALGVGMVPMLRRGLFWLTVRTKVKFLRRPGMLEEVAVSTRPIAPEPGAMRCLREYRVERDGAPLILGRTEWAVMDVAAGKPVPIEGVFPGNLDFAKAPDYDEPFLRVTGSLANADVLGEYTVRSTDIDIGGHMNNVAYVRALLGLIPTAEQKAREPAEAEVVFLSPCFEGETLTFRTRMKDGAREVAAFRPEGKLALLARLAMGE